MHTDHSSSRIRRGFALFTLTAVLGLSALGLTQCRMMNATGVDLKSGVHADQAKVQTDAGADQVVICHIPPGNPDNPQTITVGAASVSAHLAHGDHIGPCTSGPTCEEQCAAQRDLCRQNFAGNPDLLLLCEVQYNDCISLCP